MDFEVVPMTGPHARGIATWKYEGEYAFYNSDADPHDLAALLDPAAWADPPRGKGLFGFAVLDDQGCLVGFFQFNQVGRVVDVGLGLRPDLTGRGLGLAFLTTGLEFAHTRYSPDVFTLSVATFNHRAITVYERAGFRSLKVFQHETNGAEFEFVEMNRPA